MTYLRDAQPLIVQCDTEVIRSVHGLEELFNLPSVTLRACYAVPSSSTSAKAVESNADVNMADGPLSTPAPAVLNEGSSRSGWLIGEDLIKAEKEDGFQESHEVRWPFRPSRASDDWEGREYVLSHLLQLHGIQITSNSSPLLLIPPPSPPSLPLSTQAAYTQLAFETLNTPVFSIFPSPLASLYALNQTTGIIIHIGRHESTVFVVTDNIVRWECSATVEVGQADCEEWFEKLLFEDEWLEKELKAAAEKEDLSAEEKRKLVKEVANFVWTECTGDDLEVPPKGGKKSTAVVSAPDKEDDAFDVAKKLVGETAPPANPSHKSKKQQAQIAAAAAKTAAAAAEAAAVAAASQPVDVIIVTIPSLSGKEIPLGPVRHRLCDPLFNGKTAGGDTVWEGVGRAVDNTSLSLGERMVIWGGGGSNVGGVGVVGELARIKSFAPSLMTYLSPYLLSSADMTSDCQPGKLNLLQIPEYFANYKNATCEVAPFLGGSLVAKFAFSDAQGSHCISKVDYNARGPAAIYNVTADGQ